MIEESNFNEFCRVIILNSVSKEYYSAIKEWYYKYTFKEDNNCICGQFIFNNCVIINKLNNNTLIVGNVCINKFMGLNYDFIIKGIKSIHNDKIPNKEFIVYCFDKGYIYVNQMNFLLNIKRKRKLTSNQIQFKEKILFKLKVLKNY